MQIELIFYTQIFSIVAFIVTVFGLYHLLVSQKESVIELLKERNEYLELQLKDAKNQSPDVLLESLSKRVEASKEEISRLSSESEEHKEHILGYENELKSISSQLNKINFG